MRNAKRIVPGMVIAAFMGFFLLQHTDTLNAESTNIFPDLQKFTDCLDLIQKYYVEEVKPSTLIDGAIKGMVSVLDPHSAYLSKEDYKEMQISTTGSFGGLGIEIGSVTASSPSLHPLRAHPPLLPVSAPVTGLSRSTAHSPMKCPSKMRLSF